MKTMVEISKSMAESLKSMEFIDNHHLTPEIVSGKYYLHISVVDYYAYASIRDYLISCPVVEIAYPEE